VIGALPYRGRLAPSPTGYLHLGHARTFLIAAERAKQFGGTLILRNEDRVEKASRLRNDLSLLLFAQRAGCVRDCAERR
jgi:glutamyl/glutaminyl-tRNA synthetase